MCLKKLRKYCFTCLNLAWWQRNVFGEPTHDYRIQVTEPKWIMGRSVETAEFFISSPENNILNVTFNRDNSIFN